MALEKLKFELEEEKAQKSFYQSRHKEATIELQNKVNQVYADKYSTLLNKRAGWNKMCRLENSAKIGNFKNLKLN